MAYMSSSAPLPQNSLDPLPASEVAASNARILQAFWQSRTGRERVYANLPTADSFYAQWPGLAVDAAQIIPQSEAGRQSVLNGLSYPLDSTELVAGPEVVSLNGGSSQDMTTSANAVIPNPAPVQLPNGLWFSGQKQFSTSSHVVTTSKRPQSFASHSAQRGCGNSANGPGCSALPPAFRPLAVTVPAPPAAPNPPGPEPWSVVRQGYSSSGLGGIAPPWGQAEILPVPRTGSGSGFPWLLALAGAGVFGLLASKRKRGRRK